MVWETGCSGTERRAEMDDAGVCAGVRDSREEAAGDQEGALRRVRLVASDMDGTLLGENSQVPPETFSLVRDLCKHGVRFVAASGRRYDTLREYFAPVDDFVDYVASNGTVVVAEGRLLDRETYSHLSLIRLAREVAKFDTMHLVAFDSVRSFLLEPEASYGREIDKDLPDPLVVGTMPGPEANVVKVSVYCDESPLDMAYILTREMGDEFVFAPSGHRWIDVMQRGVNKATGLRFVMAHYGIKPEEVMAFGDSMNDYEILRMVGFPRAMGNGRSAIKQIAGKAIGTNAEHAVQAELRALLDALEAR